MRLLKTKKSFKKEFKRQIRFALVAAVGFTIAFAWRNAIYNSAKEIVDKFSQTTHVIMTEIYTAIFITVLAVILIFLTSKLLKDK